ncbi:MAG: nicotinate phosphoribosyltransferase [Spirochaetales bacterium]|nr:nicotinate phosphoribosyltransferase [Spirochaetales bacterium]
MNLQSGLLLDYYELTMAHGYFRKQMDYPAVFDLFFRKNPFSGGFIVFAGLETALRKIKELRFSHDDIAYLRDQNRFDRAFLDYLADFRFRGDILSCPEGTILFPNEPAIRVHASLVEAQLIEGILLNCINYQSLIASKAARIFHASGQGCISEFGFRKAHGIENSVLASRAAFIGGASSTSNTLAGRILNIPVKGTMAHSWVMAFPSEYEAFSAYAGLYPDDCVLLVDTYNTLLSGLPNAIKVGLELKEKGYANFGIRLDSGNIEKLAQKARSMLDIARLPYAGIVLSNEFDEFSVARLKRAKTPVDIWGIGTNLVTGNPDSAMSGVYKLAAYKKDGSWIYTNKLSDDETKMSYPGIKKVFRCYSNGFMAFDYVCLESDQQLPVPGSPDFGSFPAFNEKSELLDRCMKDGNPVRDTPRGLIEIREYFIDELKGLPWQYKRLKHAAKYRVIMSSECRSQLKKTKAVSRIFKTF